MVNGHQLGADVVALEGLAGKGGEVLVRHALHGLGKRLGRQVATGRLQARNEPARVGIGVGGVLVRLLAELGLVVGKEPLGLGILGVGVIELPAAHAVQTLDRILAQSGHDGAATRHGGEHFHLVPIELLDFGHHAHGLAHHRTGHDEIHIGGLHLGHLRGKLDVTDLVGRLGCHGHVGGLHGRGHTRADQVAKWSFLVDHAHALGLPGANGPAQAGGRGAVVIGHGGEHQRAVARDFLDDGRGCPGREHDHAGVGGHLGGGCVRSRAKGVDDGKHAIALDQLLRSAHGHLRLAAVVFDEQTDLAAMDAGGVGLIDAHLHGVAQHGHARCGRT